MAEALQYAEVQGRKDCHNIPGASGEIGCWQFLSATWDLFATDVLGYVPERTYINERYVVVKKVERWLKLGYTPYEIGLIWNGGQPVEKKGVNSHGQAYDSGAHARKVVVALNQIYGQED